MVLFQFLSADVKSLSFEHDFYFGTAFLSHSAVICTGIAIALRSVEILRLCETISQNIDHFCRELS